MTSTPPARPTRTRRLRGQGWLIALGVLAALPAAVATALRVVAPSTEQLAKVASFIPYGLVFWLPALLFLGIAAVRAVRARSSGRPAVATLALLCATGLAATVAWEGPAFIADRRPVGTGTVTIASLNVAQSADQAAVARAVTGADIVVFVEAQPGWAAQMPASLRAEFPYATPAIRDLNGGSLILSRYPIIASQKLPESSFQQWAATVRTPQLGALRVVGVHPCNPYCPAGFWAREAEQLRSWLAQRDPRVPTVVAGDFNAVDDHLTMRRLYDDGFRSAADLAGAGFVRTWPSDRRFPPLIAIDHVLVTSDLTATEFSTFDVPRTDHLGIRTVIAGVED